MTNNRDCLSNYQQFDQKEPVTLGDEKTVEAHGKGRVQLKLDSGKTGTLEAVLYVPKLSYNLLSVAAATDQDMVVEFDQISCQFENPEGQTVGTGARVNRMYQLDIKSNEATQVAESDNKMKLWHQPAAAAARAAAAACMHACMLYR